MFIKFESRSKVMHALRVIDPDGSSARAKHRILRRMYISQVSFAAMYPVWR